MMTFYKKKCYVWLQNFQGLFLKKTQLYAILENKLGGVIYEKNKLYINIYFCGIYAIDRMYNQTALRGFNSFVR